MDIWDRLELLCIFGYLFAVAIVMLLLVVVFSLAFIKSQLIYGKNKVKILIGVVK